MGKDIINGCTNSHLHIYIFLEKMSLKKSRDFVYPYPDSLDFLIEEILKIRQN